MIIWRTPSTNCGLSSWPGFRRSNAGGFALAESVERTRSRQRWNLACKRSFMHDELKEEAIVNKVGGRFKLSTLIQKRMVALNTGARPLVDLRTPDKMAIVVQEILQDKIFLDLSGNVQTREGTTVDKAGHAAMLEG